MNQRSHRTFSDENTSGGSAFCLGGIEKIQPRLNLSFLLFGFVCQRPFLSLEGQIMVMSVASLVVMVRIIPLQVLPWNNFD
jgi:hypothetical protein